MKKISMIVGLLCFAAGQAPVTAVTQADADTAAKLRGEVSPDVWTGRFKSGMKDDDLHPTPKEQHPTYDAATGMYLSQDRNPLIRIVISYTTSPYQRQEAMTALVDPKNNEFFMMRIQEPMAEGSWETTFRGPVPLPRSARFRGTSYSLDDVRQLTKLITIARR